MSEQNVVSLLNQVIEQLYTAGTGSKETRQTCDLEGHSVQREATECAWVTGKNYWNSEHLNKNQI
jgi:hypothetical protein